MPPTAQSTRYQSDRLFLLSIEALSQSQILHEPNRTYLLQILQLLKGAIATGSPSHAIPFVESALRLFDQVQPEIIVADNMAHTPGGSDNWLIEDSNSHLDGVAIAVQQPSLYLLANLLTALQLHLNGSATSNTTANTTANPPTAQVSPASPTQYATSLVPDQQAGLMACIDICTALLTDS